MIAQIKYPAGAGYEVSARGDPSPRSVWEKPVGAKLWATPALTKISWRSASLP